MFLPLVVVRLLLTCKEHASGFLFADDYHSFAYKSGKYIFVNFTFSKVGDDIYDFHAR